MFVTSQKTWRGVAIVVSVAVVAVIVLLRPWLSPWAIKRQPKDVPVAQAVKPSGDPVLALIRDTGDPDWKVRWDAVNELGKLKDRRAVPALVDRALYDDNPHIYPD